MAPGISGEEAERFRAIVPYKGNPSALVAQIRTRSFSRSYRREAVQGHSNQPMGSESQLRTGSLHPSSLVRDDRATKPAVKPVSGCGHTNCDDCQLLLMVIISAAQTAKPVSTNQRNDVASITAFMPQGPRPE